MTNEFQFGPPSKLKTIAMHMKAVLESIKGKETQLLTQSGTVRDPFLTPDEQRLVDQGKIQDPEWD